MGLNEEHVGKLEEAAEKRKKRLEEIKNKKMKIESIDENNDEPKALFRNYTPNAETLKKNQLPAIEPENIQNLIQDQLNEENVINQLDNIELSNLAPKKVTYDIHRAIKDKYEKLERKTDKAIAELIRQRLSEGIQQDFVLAVEAAPQTQQQIYDSDSD